jgi:hypothetical protein
MVPMVDYPNFELKNSEFTIRYAFKLVMKRNVSKTYGDLKHSYLLALSALKISEGDNTKR